MEQILELTWFYKVIMNDARIGTSHISLYMALFQSWNLNAFCSPVSINRQEVMKLAKVSSSATYHKCMRDLVAYGYINYIPSHNPSIRSLVFLRQDQDINLKRK